MDLETENRIAAILMKEAAELRRQAARDGIDAYLHPPNVRGRPNSRFLTATVLGVQQSNRAVEVNEMWRARQKEKEMDNRVKKDDKKRTNNERNRDYERKHSSLCSSSKSASEDGLKDKDIEEFLHSRAKRGRGAVGSRMDETGPYLPESKGKDLMSRDDDNEWWENRSVLGPQKPSHLGVESSSDEDCFERRVKREGSRKHRSKDKGKDKEKKKKKKTKREKKRSKNH